MTDFLRRQSGIGTTAVLAWLTGSSLLAAQPNTGSITGRVHGLGSAKTLSGALVQVKGTALVASTDIAGTFRIDRAPLGRQTLLVTYLGFDPASIEVQVVAGQTLLQDIQLRPAAQYYETVTVSETFLEGQARALNQQKNAINIKNIVSADQLGRFPDANSAEAAQRIPGVSIQRDQGEGRFVLIRGVEPRLSTTSINGAAVPAPAGDIRYVALDVIPADLLEALEVIKTITPDMDGDTIGGALNLVTKQAPGGTRLNVTAGGGYNDINSGSNQVLNGAWAQRFRDGRAGLVLSGSFRNTDRGSDTFEVEYDDGELAELELREYSINRKRWGFNGDYQFQATPDSNYWVRGMFNKFDDREFRRRTSNRVGKERMERELKDRFVEQIISNIAAGTTQRLGNSLQLDLEAAFGFAEENEPDRLDTTFGLDDVVFDPNVSAHSIDPDNIQANPLNEDMSGYRLDEAVAENNKATDRNFILSADLTQPFGGADANSHWKAGAKYRYQRKEQDANATVLLPDRDILLGSLIDPDFDEDDFFDGRYVVGPHIGADAARALAPGLEREVDLEEDLADYEARENTFAGYGLVELDLGSRTQLLAGARYEYIDVDYTSRQLLFNAAGDLESVTPTDGTNDYAFFLPMLHLRYEVAPDANFRTALTRSFARPNFEEVVLFRLIRREENLVELGNAELRPTEAWNVDVLGEKYFSTVGVLSGGFFYKTLSDTIFISRDVQEIGGETFDVIQPRNLDNADLVGLEGAFQNTLRFLPSPLDGLAVFANYTYTSSSADIPGREGIDNRLPGQAENVGNFAILYEKYGFSGRLSWNYVSEYLCEVGASPERDLFIDSHVQLDLALSLQVANQ